MFDDQEVASEGEYEYEYESNDYNGNTNMNQNNFTMDDLYEREAYTTTVLLIETQDLLYSNVIETNDTNDTDEVTRPPTFGYEAHVEKVNSKEASKWQSAFKYMCVTGVSIPNPNTNHTSSSSSSPVHIEEVNNTNDTNDCIQLEGQVPVPIPTQVHVQVQGECKVEIKGEVDIDVDEYICSDGYYDPNNVLANNL